MSRDSRLLGRERRRGPRAVECVRIADEIDRAAREYPTTRVVQGIVIASAVQRGIVKAINWLARHQVQNEVFATVEEAVAWAQRELRAPPVSGKKLAG